MHELEIIVAILNPKFIEFISYLSAYRDLKKKTIELMSHFFTCRDLSFKKGDVIILRKKIDSNWYQGELNNQLGFFPASYVQVRNSVLCLIL